MIAPLQAALVRPRRPVNVLVEMPGTDDLQPQRMSGKLLAAMYARGVLHHYRVETPDGILFLVPPAWLIGEPPVLALAAERVLAEARA